jgi:hypothetical protein
MSIEEDYFIPVRPGSATDITNLAGGANTTAIDDVKYLRDKLFSALKIPQSYLAMGEGAAAEDKTTLAQKDIRFSRTIQRLQRVIIAELEKVGIIHLYTLGFRGDDLLSFNLSLNNPSKIAELQEIEHWKQKFDIAASATEGFFSRRWVADHIFGLSNEEFVRNQREMYYDRKHDATLQQVAEAAAAAETAGAMAGGDMGGDMGGEMPPAGEDLGAPAEIPAGDVEGPPGEPEAGGGEESALLAVPPGSRNAPRLTPGSKGKVYKPVRDDKRNRGARSRSYASQHASEKSSATLRNIFPGSEINSLAKTTGLANGVYEENTSIYSMREQTEEGKLFHINNSIRTLIQDLEKTQDVLTEQKDENKA